MRFPTPRVRASRALAGLLAAGLCVAACSTPSPQRSPAGEPFPQVAVAGPDGQALLLPAAAGGEPAVVLLALDGRAQFDLDRWLLGLQQLAVEAPVFQLAAGRGLRPTDRSGWLSAAEREALPRAGWTFATAEGGAAEALRAATGDAASQNVRALVLDADGRIQWSSAVGYSAARARKAAALLSSLRAEAALAAGAAHPLVGRAFPAVRGSSLAGEDVALPQALAGAPALLLVGYEQEAQIDIDRWIVGLLEAGCDARLLELPTIPSMFASFASGFIDDGMRGGIPEEDWGAVVTLYGGAARPVAALTGREDGRRARVLLLAADGTIAWFDDGGYTPAKARAVVAALRDRG